jgi:hypothetical protein
MKTFEKCNETVPRPHGVYTCDLPTGHNDLHVHVCPEPDNRRGAYTTWKITSGNSCRSRPETPEGYLRRYNQALAAFEARMHGLPT